MLNLILTRLGALRPRVARAVRVPHPAHEPALWILHAR